MTPTPQPQRTRVGSVVKMCLNAIRAPIDEIEPGRPLHFPAVVADHEHVVAEVLSPTCVRTTRNHVIKSWIVVCP